MTLRANIAELVEQAIQAVPHQLRRNLQNCVTRAHSGELPKIAEQLLGNADAAWQTFDSAAKSVEKKLQE